MATTGAGSSPAPSPARTAGHTTYQLRCHVRKGGHARLDEVRRMLNTLYNAALQERRDAWRMAGKSMSLYDQNASLTAVRADWPEWADLDTAVARECCEGSTAP